MRKSVIFVFCFFLFISGVGAQVNQIVLMVAGQFTDKDTAASNCFNGQFIPICKGANTFDDLASMKMSSVSVKVYSGVICLGTIDLSFPVSGDKNAQIQGLVKQIKNKGYIYYEKPIVEMIKKSGEKSNRTVADVNIFIDQKKGVKCKSK